MIIKQNKVGMTLGKFAPFHMGHESLVRRMFADGCDKVIVCVYDFEGYGISTERRANWIKSIFNDSRLTVVSFENSPQGVGYTPEIKKLHEDYFESEMLKNGISTDNITHFYCSEPYGKHMSDRFNWKLEILDLTRNDINISATKIRNMYKDYFKFLHPVVQRDLPKLITLLGGESTGKTTLGRYLNDNFNVGYIPEHGAAYWYEHNKDGKLNEDDINNIMKLHNDKRDKAVSMSEFPFFIEDTNNLTTWLFGYEYGLYLDIIPNSVIKSCSKTNLYVVCDDNIPFDSSGGRISELVRQKFNKRYIEFLNDNNLPYIIVSGTVEERARQVMEVLYTL